MKMALAWVAFCTIVVRETRRTFRVWRQSFLPAIVTSTLYFVIFGKIIGQKVGMIDQFPYIQYIAPGLIMMQVITSTYTSGASAFFMAKFQKQIQELQVSPMPAYVIVLGFMISAIVRGIITGILVTAITLFFTHLHVHSWLIIIAVTLCSSILFALAGLVNAIYAKTFDDITVVPTFILAPLTYLGGVFYSINLLPKAWQLISFINPIAYIINTFRFGILGVADASIVLAFFVMAVLIIILFIFAYYLINSGRGLRE
jgi:ABC-2 type transport system permease protein